MTLAALLLNAALALPINLEDVPDSAEIDEHFEELLCGNSMEDEVVSSEHGRVRRTPIEDPDPDFRTPCESHATHAHDELAHMHLGHKHVGRERRAVGEDSSGNSSEEKQATTSEQPQVIDGEQPKKEKIQKDKDSSSSEEKQDKQPKEEPKQKDKDSSSSEETKEKQPNEEPNQQELATTE
ncbi:GH21622 [Drosophila grimshawi]|uniref:GH21622 n=1 Tax=Drosophila grimshawi TaxID=7222 RepID=B4J5C1_DROGR|nr:GH21622 [Drosophila grimshawi]